MLQLVHVEYWAGKKKQPSVMFMVGTDESGQFVGLKSEKLLDPDIKKIRQHKDTLVDMNSTELHGWLGKNLQGYHNALCKLKKGRYNIIESFGI